jgi:hypothetical protein
MTFATGIANGWLQRIQMEKERKQLKRGKKRIREERNEGLS